MMRMIERDTTIYLKFADKMLNNFNKFQFYNSIIHKTITLRRLIGTIEFSSSRIETVILLFRI